MRKIGISFTLFCFLLFVATSLFAGGGGQQETRPVQVERDPARLGNVVIRTFISGDAAWNAIVDEMVRDFQRTYPNIRVQEEVLSGNFWPRLVVMHASGTAPDIHQITPGVILPFLRSGSLMELDGFIAASDKIDFSDLWDVNNQVYRFADGRFGEGPLYAFIKDWSPDLMMFYNKQLFDAAGIEYPDPTTPMTWTQYRQILSRLSRVDDAGNFTQFATNFDFVPIEHLYQMILINGGRIFNNDGTVFSLSDPKTREAIQFFMDLMVGPQQVVPFYEEPQAMWVGDLFRTGRTAISWFGRWAIPALFDGSPNLRYGFAPPPVPPGGNRLSTIAGAVGWTMAAGTQHPDASWLFLESLMTEGQERLGQIGWNIPGNKTIAEQVFGAETDPRRREINEFFLNEGANYTVTSPISGFVSKDFVTEQITLALRDYAYGVLSLDVALRQAEDRVNAEIQDWR